MNEERAKAALDGKLPAWVKRFDVSAIEDASGSPALVISLFVESTHLTDGDALTQLRATVQRLLDEAGVVVWGYVRFEDVSEAAA